MNENYIDKFGKNEKYVSSDNSERYKVPLVLGTISLVSFVIYLISAFGERSVVMIVIYAVPILSVIGLVFSYKTRDKRDEHPQIWLGGLVSCALGLLIFVFIFFGTVFALAQS